MTTLRLAPHPQAPTRAIYGALVDTTPTQFAALDAMGLHRARTLAAQSPAAPGFAAWLHADAVFRFAGLGGTIPGDGGYAELVVEEYRGPDAWRGRWRSTRPFSTDPTGGYVCAERLGD